VWKRQARRRFYDLSRLRIKSDQQTISNIHDVNVACIIPKTICSAKQFCERIPLFCFSIGSAAGYRKTPFVRFNPEGHILKYFRDLGSVLDLIINRKIPRAATSEKDWPSEEL
jgi:hypothetical protein